MPIICTDTRCTLYPAGGDYCRRCQQEKRPAEMSLEAEWLAEKARRSAELVRKEEEKQEKERRDR